MPEYEPKAEISTDGIPDFDDVLVGYLECAEWCGIDDEERPAFERHPNPVWSRRAIRVALQDIACFVALAGEDLSAVTLDAEQIGHDLWLTRNRYGAGFWDRSLGPIGNKLTEWAHSLGEENITFDQETGELHFYGE